MASLDTLDQHVDEQFDEYSESLTRLLAQPSVSATGEGIPECADLVVELCSRYGFDESTVVETDGHPMVVASAYVDHEPDNDSPTLLVYGHYDVQPVDPEHWETPPFSPTVTTDTAGDERVYARGAGDNKGQFFTHLCAVESLRAVAELPLNVTLLLEGEEEIGSPNLQSAVRAHSDRLGADLVFNADGPMERENHPEVNMGTRGLLYFEITATGPERDLHSGNFGGPVPNPIWGLVDLLASMRDEDGRAAIDGFYDDVEGVSERAATAVERIPFTDESMLDETGSRGLAPGAGDSYYEKLLLYPSFNIAGIHGGYGGEKQKTVIPAEATAKVDLRLVENQDPDRVFGLFTDHIDEHASDLFSWDVTEIGNVAPLRVPLDAPFREPVVEAVTDVWEQEPVVKPSCGGAGPYHVFDEELGVPYIAVPYANVDEQNHAPNENLKLRHFHDGIRTSVRVFQHLGESLA
jgi:acetylornithine deacetylase/succinyl-diaminopimelate desuccinylase-like protein